MDSIDDAQRINEARIAECIRSALCALSGDGSDECDECGETIPEARRRAMPSARRCVGCQTLFEQNGALP